MALQGRTKTSCEALWLPSWLDDLIIHIGPYIIWPHLRTRKRRNLLSICFCYRGVRWYIDPPDLVIEVQYVLERSPDNKNKSLLLKRRQGSLKMSSNRTQTQQFDLTVNRCACVQARTFNDRMICARARKCNQQCAAESWQSDQLAQMWAQIGAIFVPL